MRSITNDGGIKEEDRMQDISTNMTKEPEFLLPHAVAVLTRSLT